VEGSNRSVELRPFAQCRRAARVAAALALGIGAPLRAQGAMGSGDGYLFGAPAVHFTLRMGYAHANAGSDLFDEVIRDLTLEKRNFSGAVIGSEIGFVVSPRFDLSFNLDYAWSSKRSEYRNFIDNQNLPIEQTTSLKRVPLTANVRAYLAPRGRSVGRLAWIPTTVVPWIGAGGGAIWYRFRQEGDFVDFNTSDVFNADIKSEGWAPAAQAMGGLDYTISPRVAITGDARYTWARASLGRDFVGFDKIDLSGVSAALGLTFRL
jgi:hypothetical protein